MPTGRWKEETPFPREFFSHPLCWRLHRATFWSSGRSRCRCRPSLRCPCCTADPGSCRFWYNSCFHTTSVVRSFGLLFSLNRKFLSAKKPHDAVYSAKDFFVLNGGPFIRIVTVHNIVNVITVHMMQQSTGSFIWLFYMSVPTAYKYNCSLFRFWDRSFISEETGAKISL